VRKRDDRMAIWPGRDCRVAGESVDDEPKHVRGPFRLNFLRREDDQSAADVCRRSRNVSSQERCPRALHDEV